MDEIKDKAKAYRRSLTFKQRYLDYNENPILFLFFSWKFHYYNKLFKYAVELTVNKFKRGTK